MSDDYIHIIPADPGVVPDEAKQQAAVSYFQSIATQVSEVSSSVSDRLEFVHCGGNFETICCPACDAEIELELWQGWIDQDYSDKGFTLVKHPMPCCGTQHARLRRETTLTFKAIAVRVRLGSSKSANAKLHSRMSQQSERSAVAVPIRRTKRKRPNA